MVGCVIVRGGKVLARGFHHRAGLAHAEVDALSKLRGRAPGATVYVTLEPCDHTGRTGPCSEALIAAGVKRVVCGMREPNPVARGGLARLKRAGIETVCGVLEAECRALNADWIHWIETGRPRVTLKAAVTLDGRLSARGGDARWVTGEAARARGHLLRHTHDAILVGAGTVRADDPQLTTRLSAGRGRDPLRVVLDGRLSIPAGARVLPALILSTRDAAERPDLERAGAEVLRLPGRRGRIRPADVLRALGRRGVQSLLVEGGGELHGQLMAAGLVDHVVLFIAPKLIGAGGTPLLAVPGRARMAEAWRLDDLEVRRLGEDLWVEGRPVRPPQRRP
jgi:diaminohydroxyphosphoribosylaminopyrimidine deaminase/5-amino-6-(5-phosphoribosylamino)uracil reductase